MLNITTEVVSSEVDVEKVKSEKGFAEAVRFGEAADLGQWPLLVCLGAGDLPA